MKIRKTIEVDIKIEKPEGFEVSRKYKLGYALIILQEPDYDETGDSGVAIVFEERTGTAYLTSYGFSRTKKEIQGHKDFWKGHQFICVGQRLEHGKREPIFEMIIKEPVCEWE